MNKRAGDGTLGASVSTRPHPQMSFANIPTLPPHLGKLDELVKTPWIVNEPTDLNTRYTFDVEELQEVQRFAKLVLLDDLPRHTAEVLPERYLTIRRLYNMYRSPLKQKPLPPLPPFANLEDTKINQQINRDANKRKNITKNIGESHLNIGLDRHNSTIARQAQSTSNSMETKSSRRPKHVARCDMNATKRRLPSALAFKTCSSTSQDLCPDPHLLHRRQRHLGFTPCPRDPLPQRSPPVPQQMRNFSTTPCRPQRSPHQLHLPRLRPRTRVTLSGPGWN
jgi:hypothetical protein